MARGQVAAIVLGLALLPGPARATGLCEDNPRLYGTMLGFAEGAGHFAIRVSRSWCEETPDMHERRGVLDFVEVRDLKNTAADRLASVTGKDAQRLERLEGAFDHVKAGRLRAVLKERGFTEPGRAPRGRGDRCVVRTAWARAPEGINGFPAGRVSVEVREGKRLLARVEAGVAARDRRAEVQLHAHFVAARSRIAVFVRVPQCAGPPPGYFGKDDPGTCYREDVAFTTALDVAAHPALAPCFGAPASAPAK